MPKEYIYIPKMVELVDFTEKSPQSVELECCSPAEWAETICNAVHSCYEDHKRNKFTIPHIAFPNVM